MKTTLETSGEDGKTTLETGGEDVKTPLETSGEDVKTPLERSVKDPNIFSSSLFNIFFSSLRSFSSRH